MIHSKAQHKKHLLVGPGGMHCPCCAPKRSKDRQVWVRQAKRRLSRFIEKDFNTEVSK